MRYFTVFLLLFAFGLTVPACAQKTTAPKAKTKKATRKAVAPPARPATGPVLTFERTPCFGTCPGYVMEVYADGRVAYEGRRAVPLMGKKELRLPAAAVADLLRQAKEARFDQFQERYSQGATDLPSTIVGVRQPNGQLKKVAVEEGAPDNVVQLFASFANQLDALAGLRADK